jgi:hypothetical protein
LTSSILSSLASDESGKADRGFRIGASVLRLELIPLLSLVGVVLNALGGLYLAYDLLGGNRGPLGTATKSISYGILFGAAYWLPLGMWFGLAGLLASGPALGLEIRRRGAREVHPFAKALGYGSFRGFSFGAAGWLSKDPGFGISFGILSTIAFVAAFLIVGPPTQVQSGRAHVNRAVLYRAGFRGLSIGLAGIMSGMISGETHAFWYGLEVGLITGLSSGILVAIAPAIEAWVENLPNRRIGGYGAILVLIGSIFQTLQYVFPLAGLPTR